MTLFSSFQKPIVRFETLGCKLNQIESESAAHSFADAGFDCRMDGINSSFPGDTVTFLCIVNTCTVTAKAEQKCRRIIRLLLEKYPCAAVLITGCYAQLDGDFLAAMDNRIAVLGGRHKDALIRLPAFLRSFMSGAALCSTEAAASVPACKDVSMPVFEASCESAFALAAQLRDLYKGSFDTDKKCTPVQPHTGRETFALSTDTFLQHSRPSLKIQDGCDNRCSYCRICLARGPSLSLQADRVLERVLQLEKIGHREVILTGVNIGQYRFSSESEPFSGGLTFLLAYLLEHTDTISFRLSSLHPQIINDELCAVLSHERIRPHFHLSVQSGSDAVLKAMRRPYNAECITRAVEHLRRIKNRPFIACDIIAGFPGETREDFEKTLELCRFCNFSWIHAFPFSPRPGTDACKIKPPVPPAEARARVQELGLLAEKQKKAYIESCIGKHFKAVVEKFRTGDLRAVTENFLHVRIKQAAAFSLKPHFPPSGGTEVLLCIDSVNEAGLKGETCEAFAVLL
ncbi:tRNA (N(6)-L-threonylcarbamoyladenosine(37)-C(2))-methylthiotransferase MtaB [Treponema sp. OMZ 840]|uniref:tRNA (N(6)-L-threonylcarbamoyladenosine(37)-C(2))- methylthiotransferase MtaB n=1 Tax=Treponema sp. OMZ 840 TaxID=244313 RepID=UPI003D8B3750